ncbi:MAG: site-specific integrase [Treponema sp.]|jgi:integrase|nr:site-specific integrase [Treponema sp.]
MGQKKLSVQDDFYIFPVGEVYYVKFRDPISRKILSKKSTGLRSKTLAKQWAREEWERRTINSKKTDIVFYAYAKLFYVDGCPHEATIKAAGGHFGVKTCRNYRSDLEKYILTDHIADMIIDDIDRAACIDFRDRLIAQFGYTRKANKIFQAFKNIIHTALDKGIVKTDPVNRLTIACAKKGKRIALGYDDIKRIFDSKYWNSPRLRLAVMAAALVGLRAGEVRGIKWRDIDPVKDIIFVERQFTDLEGEKRPKWEKKRTTIYPSVLKKQLESFRGAPDERVFALNDINRPKRLKGIAGPLSYRTLSSAMDKAIKSLNSDNIENGRQEIARITLHGLRHSIQTALAGGGVNPELLRATFGWTDEEVQELYTHRELYDLTPQREVTEKLFGDLKQ